MAAGGLLLAALMSGCKKPAVAKLERANTSVDREDGELPAAGKANRLLSEQSALVRDPHDHGLNANLRG